MSKGSQTEGILFQKNGKPVPLAGVEVQGDIIGRGAKVKVSQRFRNTEKKPIEAVYKFPLPENVTVCGFRALIDGRIVEGKIEEKEKAFELYDKALADGHKAQLMDEERPNIFTLSIGNIKPDSTVIIEITYITLLDAHNSEVRFYLPTTISPRYTPASQKDDNGIPVSDIVNPTFALQVPYGLTININVHGRKAISSIESSSHTIKTNFKGDDATITFSADKAAMDRDFVLTITYEKDFTNRAFVIKDNDETFIQVDLTPDELAETGKIDNSSQGREIVFVLDCSGSMEGESIEAAKKALEIMIRALSPDTMFNIYRFGESFESLYKNSKSYDENSMQEALKYLSQTNASLGGTEVLDPLTDIYQKELESGYRRDVILITDGEISNEDEVMKLIKHHADTTKLFAVGIGSGPNEFLIKGVARAAGGATEFIAPKERIEPKALRLFQKVMAGSISSLKIDCGFDIDQSPLSPSAYINQPTSFFAKLKEDKAQNKSVKVTGRFGEGFREWIIDLEEASNQDMPISKLWAREKIREFEEGDGLLPGSQQKQRGEVKNHKAIIDISRKYGIIGKSTSFIGIEKKSDTEEATSDMVLRVVPTLVTDGWHGGAKIMASFSLSSAPSHDLSTPTYSRKHLGAYSIQSIDTCNEVNESDTANIEIPTFLRRQASEPGISFSKTARAVRKALSKIKGKDLLLDILSLQRAGGGFYMDEVILNLLSISQSELSNIANVMNIKHQEDRMGLLMAAIVLAILELKYGERRNEWDRVVFKSRNWLQLQISRVTPTIEDEPLEDWVKKFVDDRLK